LRRLSWRRLGYPLSRSIDTVFTSSSLNVFPQMSSTILSIADIDEYQSMEKFHPGCNRYI
jgi:hypothetical protein